MFARLNRYGVAPNTFDALKTFALFAMLADHAGMFLWPDCLWLRLIGRLAFPAFFFAISSRSDIVAYAVAMLAIEMLWNFPVFPLGILVSVVFSRAVMRWILRFEPHMRAQPLMVVLIGCVYHLIAVFMIDYGFFGTLFILCGYWVRTQTAAKNTGLFVYATFFMHTLFQIFSLEFTSLQIALLIVMMGAEAWIFLRFRLCKLPTYAVFYAAIPNALKFISRYSLELYVAHYLLLMGLDHALHPEAHTQFQWLMPHKPVAGAAHGLD